MPKNTKHAILTSLLALPFSAYAHGEEVLFVPLITIILTIIFSLTMLVIKPGFPCKLLLILVYIISTIITYALLNLFPFRENMELIFIITGCIPIAMVIIAYQVIKKMRTKN